MSRWDISDRDNARHAEQNPPASNKREDDSSVGPSMGRGPGEDSSATSLDRPDAMRETPLSGAAERRIEHRDRGRSYWLRSRETQALADIGRFRTVDVRDLTRFVYAGDEGRLKNDLRSLRTQGLVEEKTMYRAHKRARRLVTLTAEGERLARQTAGLPKEQRLYHGFVKPKELDHDADLYKVCQKAAQEIREKGGKPIRVRLDFELKGSINRAKERAAHLNDHERKSVLETAARTEGLTVDGTTIHLPDIQVEYETRDGRIERENLELLSANYREQGIRGKAAAGFRIYARSGDSVRIRRALGDTGALREVLSV